MPAAFAARWLRHAVVTLGGRVMRLHCARSRFAPDCRGIGRAAANEPEYVTEPAP